MTSTERLLESIEGAVIVSASRDIDGCGLHLNLADGRTLIFEGEITIGLYRRCTEKLH